MCPDAAIDTAEPVSQVPAIGRSTRLSAQPPSISLIICTHNPRPDYLARTLESLAKQTLPLDKWDLVLLDNASKDRLDANWDISWHPCGRHARDEKIGLALARIRAIQETRGELLIFADDDNVLAKDFLEQALKVAESYPYLGVFGAGAIQPEFAVQPAPEVVDLIGLLALRTVAEARWSNHYEDWPTIPWGAGLCVTRQVAEGYVALINRLWNTSVIGRNGQHLFTGEDDLFSWVAVQLGKGFGIFPNLKLTHLIPGERVTRSYFLRLIADKSTSSAVIRYNMFGTHPESLSLTAIIRMLAHGFRRGWFSFRCRCAEIAGNRRARRMIGTGKG
ncbi:MAG TPA: glycosyltransferase [Terriglobales bacterium]|nr:glycosyltransferase [Terriglobales bacterium]